MVVHALLHGFRYSYFVGFFTSLYDSFSGKLPISQLYHDSFDGPHRANILLVLTRNNLNSLNKP